MQGKINNLLQMPSLNEKRLLILGGNPETGALVQVANRLGVHTIVVDPNPNAPAKREAAEHFEIDGFDIEGIVTIARQCRADGVLVGVADILVPSYLQVCTELGVPCYATNEAVRMFSSKDHFRDALVKFNLSPTPSFQLDKALESEDLSELPLPLMIKPVDNGAGVGMVEVRDLKDLKAAILFASENSKRRKVIVERFMQCDDIFAYLTIKDGTVFLSAIGDRITTRSQQGKSLVCLATRYPSKYLTEFERQVMPNLVSLVKSTGVQNGVLAVQFWAEDGKFYGYDPGFRLQGEAPHLYLNHLQGFDHREMLIEFALTGSMGSVNLTDHNDPGFGGRHACTLWFLLTAGIIGEIHGIGEVYSDPNVVCVLQRFAVADEVTEEMVGTERQVFARIYLVAESGDELITAIRRINGRLKIYNTNRENMIVDQYAPVQ